MSKYFAKRVHCDGFSFASKKEMARYNELKIMERAGKISELFIQPEFILSPAYQYQGKPRRAVKYIADFMYLDEDGKTVIEDVKGFKTPVYKLKINLFTKTFLTINPGWIFIET